MIKKENMNETDTSSLDIKFQQRFSKNFISNIAFFILNITIGLYMVPYFLDTLGLAAYGLIPLATSVTMYVTFLIDGMNHSIVRYLTIDLQRGNTESANITFNSALFGTLGLIVVILVPIVLVLSWFAPVVFSIGDNSHIDVFTLFVLIAGSVLLRTWSSNFMAILFAYNRLDYRNYVNISNLCLYVCLVVLFFTLFTPSLVFVGVAYMTAAIFSVLLAIYLSFRICPSLKISFSLYSRHKFMSMSGLATWVILDLVGLTLNANVALVLTNILLGDVAQAEYSLILQWYTLIMGVAGLITNMLTPMIYNYYAKGDREGLIRFSCFCIKCMGLFIIPIMGCIYIFTPQLLELWLHTDKYTYLAPLLWIIIFPILLRVQTAPITTIGIGYGKVKIPALYSLFSGFLNIILTIVSVNVFGAGIYGVAVSGAITMTLFSGVFCPLYMAYVLKAPMFLYIKYHIRGVVYFIAFLVFGFVVKLIIPANTIISMFIIAISLLTIYLIFVLKVALNSSEKKYIVSLLPEYLTKVMPK